MYALYQLLLLVGLLVFAHLEAASIEQGNVDSTAHHHTWQSHFVRSSQRSLQENDKPEGLVVTEYELWKPQWIKERLEKWSYHYTNFVRVTTSQEAYGLPTAGGSSDCPYDQEGDGCRNYFVVIQDYLSHPEGSESSKRLPEVLWSGELHGNERVGPTAVMEAAELLLSAANCEAAPRVSQDPARNGGKTDNSTWEEELSTAQKCRKDLKAVGIQDEQRKWLARLVSTRRIVVVPTANALGYYRNKREEDNLDANRDFPFDLKDPRKCMQTIAGRTLNEIFREHLFQLALTFHGGTEVVGYEWGAPSWENYASPDDTAQSLIGGAYSRFAGGWSSTRPYVYGNMNELVYPVNGGMEDWAYAGSWDLDHVIQCEPQTFGGYPKEKTIYSNSTLRVFNMLIETSNEKVPRKEDLGTSLDVLRSDTKGNGHVSRNIRLALLSAELVEPYLSIKTINGLDFIDDIVPLADHASLRSCQNNRGVLIAPGTERAIVEWTIGGALQIDDTQLWYAKWSDVDVSKLDCWSQPSADDLEKFFQVASPLGATSGRGTFAQESPAVGDATRFSAEVDLKPFKNGDSIVILALARVDQSWSSRPKNVGPDVPPQSHIVNVRTNPNWYHEIEGSIIQGRLKWFSQPFTIKIDAIDNPTNKTEGIMELSTRFTSMPQIEPDPSPFFPPASSKAQKSRSGMTGMLVGMVVVGVVLLLIGQAVFKRYSRVAKRSQIIDFIEDETAISPGLRQKPQQNGNAYLDDDEDYEHGGYSDTGDVPQVEMRRYNIS